MSWFAKLCATKRSRSSDLEESAVVSAQTPPNLRGTTTTAPDFVTALEFDQRKNETRPGGLSVPGVVGTSEEEERDAQSMKDSSDHGNISSGNDESLPTRGPVQIYHEEVSSPASIETTSMPVPPIPSRTRSLTPLNFTMTPPTLPPPGGDIETSHHHPSTSHSISLIPPTPIDKCPSIPLPTAIPICPSLETSSTYSSPTSSLKAQHRRTSSHNGPHGTVKETLNAYESDGGEGGMRSVNQYVLKGELGRGSYATVERACDRETGIEYVSSLDHYVWARADVQ